MDQKDGIYEVDLLCISPDGDTSIRDALIFLGHAIPHNDYDNSLSKVCNIGS